MKLKNELFTSDFIPALKRLEEEKLPKGVAFMIAKVVDELQKNFSIYEKLRMKLVNQYGKKDKEGKLVEKEGKVSLENIEGFNKEFEELLQIENEYNIEPISLPEVIYITPKDIRALRPILK